MVVVVLPVACSTGSDEGATATPAELSEADVQVVERYIAAMAAGDVAGAQAYRCTDSAIADEDIELATDHMRRLQDENGLLTFSRAELVTDPPPFDVLTGLADAAVLRVWVAFEGAEREQPLLYFVGTDGAERRICGYAQARSSSLTDATDRQPADLGATEHTIDELIDVPVPAGFTEVEPPGPPEADEDMPIPVERTARAFMDPSGYGGVTVSAARFASPDAAREWAEQALYRSLGDAVGLNVLLQPDGALAVPIAGFNDTYVQPADTWPLIVGTILRYGDVVVSVHQSAVHPDGPDSVWLGVVAAVHQIATDQAA
jgi:hypothetical protein